MESPNQAADLLVLFGTAEKAVVRVLYRRLKIDYNVVVNRFSYEGDNLRTRAPDMEGSVFIFVLAHT